jgi:hypothetical protein
MEIANYTPWSHLVFRARTPDDDAFGVLVVRGTFRIVQGEPLRPVPDQAPVAICDRHRGEPGSSSLRMEADLAPFKPRTDIHLDAIAHAPEGRPSTRWPVRVRVGSLQKDLLVRGPCEWRHQRLLGWRLNEPEPCVEVPIRYENAFGGTFTLEDGTVVSSVENPVGTGWLPSEAPKDQPIRAPQVLAIDEPDHRPGRRYPPQGYGPLSPNWQPRLARAGTFDERWLDERWPILPADFDYAFYNAAHPDMIYPSHVAGDESVLLVGLSPTRPVVSFRLPGYQINGLLRLGSGFLLPLVAVLDTIFIDVSGREPDEHRVSLTWRACFPLGPAIDAIEVRMLRQGESARGQAIRAELRKMHG